MRQQRHQNLLRMLHWGGNWSSYHLRIPLLYCIVLCTSYLAVQGVTELNASATNSSGSIIAIRCNVTSDQSVMAAAQFVKADLKGKGLWALVSNAGISGHPGPDDWLSISVWSLLSGSLCIILSPINYWWNPGLHGGTGGEHIGDDSRMSRI